MQNINQKKESIKTSIEKDLSTKNDLINTYNNIKNELEIVNNKLNSDKNKLNELNKILHNTDNAYNKVRILIN